jgi:hypothetical protein
MEHYVEGPAAIWYRSIAPQLPTATWETFCQWLHDRFDRDQHELLLRQIFSVRQLGTMSKCHYLFSARRSLDYLLSKL